MFNNNYDFNSIHLGNYMMNDNPTYSSNFGLGGGTYGFSAPLTNSYPSFSSLSSYSIYGSNCCGRGSSTYSSYSSPFRMF